MVVIVTIKDIISWTVIGLLILFIVAFKVYVKITDLRRARRAREDSLRRQQGR